MHRTPLPLLLLLLVVTLPRLLLLQSRVPSAAWQKAPEKAVVALAAVLGSRIAATPETRNSIIHGTKAYSHAQKKTRTKSSPVPASRRRGAKRAQSDSLKRTRLKATPCSTPARPTPSVLRAITHREPVPPPPSPCVSLARVGCSKILRRIAAHAWELHHVLVSGT